jgi:hypothetical protein
MRQGHLEDLILVVAIPADLIGPDEVHQNVLMWQRDA